MEAREADASDVSRGKVDWVSAACHPGPLSPLRPLGPHNPPVDFNCHHKTTNESHYTILLCPTAKIARCIGLLAILNVTPWYLHGFQYILWREYADMSCVNVYSKALKQCRIVSEILTRISEICLMLTRALG